MNDIPIIRLEVDRMKFSMAHAIMTYHDDLEKRIEAEIERAIANFDFEVEVRRAADEAIRQVVGDTMRNLIGHDLREQIEQDVRRAVVERLKK